MSDPTDPIWHRITCEESEQFRRHTLSVSAGFTNYVGGEVLNPQLPAFTRTVWCDDKGHDVLRDEMDADGCHHWRAGS